MLIRTGASKPAPVKACEIARTLGDRLPSGSPKVKRLFFLCLLTPGAMTSQAGSTTQPLARYGTINGHWRSSGSTEVNDRCGSKLPSLMRLQCANNNVLYIQIGRI